MSRVNAVQVDGKIALGGEQPLYLRPHDIALATPQTAAIKRMIVGIFFAGSVTRVIVRLDDGQVVTVDALGPTTHAPGAPTGVVFQRPRPFAGE